MFFIFIADFILLFRFKNIPLLNKYEMVNICDEKSGSTLLFILCCFVIFVD